jgi:hypothetical protein
MVFSISACLQQQVRLQTVYSSNNCALREQAIMSFHSLSELNQFLQSAPGNFSQAPLTLPEIDYDSQTLLLYAAGQKPTSGYSIELYNDEAVIKDQILYLPVRLRKPEAGGVQAQVVTSPCQIYTLPVADYYEIAIKE